ncbi:restriction endonuclease subunit S [Staphylococcus epidermidis]|nr:restriction endonuclease subunit S [Staphylococcus epidermidis]MDH9059951.1 restriction endonuclease subunit S [Staphylococcus epidermidis]
MTNEMNTVPELRFPNFCDEWVNYKLGEIVDIRGRIGFRGYTKSDIIDKEDGGILTFSPTNIISNKLKNTVHDTYITKEKYEESPEIMVKNGDILFVKTGSTLGKSTLVTNLNEEATVNPQIVVMRVKEFFHQKFTSTYLTLNKILRQVAQIRIGGAIPTLTESEIKKFQVSFPAYEEQKKIGYFFSKLDRQIELEEEKLELLEQQKRGYMQKIFSQELRFKDERGNNHPSWKEMKLMEFLSVIDGDRGKNYPTKNDFMENGHTLFLSATNVTKQGFSLNQSQYITKEKSNSMGKGKLNINDVVLTTRGSIGNVFLYNEKIAKKNPFVRINSGMLILRTEDYIKSFFITKYLVSPLGKKQIDLLSFGSAQPQLTKKNIELYKIKLPVRQEQKQISLFLKKIDKIIEKQSSKVELLKQRKQGLLQKMFV